MSIKGIGTIVSFGVVSFAFYNLVFPTIPSSASDSISYSSSSEVGINVKESIKVAVDKNALVLEDGLGNTQIAPEASGTLITGDVNVAVATNAYGGYALGVYTADSTTAMIHNNTGVSAAINSISTISGYDATNGLVDLSTDTWGFRKYNESTTSWSDWYGVGTNSNDMAIIGTKGIGEGSSIYCDDLSFPTANSGCATGSYDTYRVGFGAKLTSALPAGTYTNNVIFSAIATEANTFLSFNANTPSGIAVTGSMAPKSILKGSAVTIPSTTFKRAGLGVKGWALTPDATTVSTVPNPADPTNPASNIPLTPGATVDVDSLIAAAGIPAFSTGPIPLYAVWDNAYNINYIANNPEGTTTTGTMNPTTSVLGLDTTIPSTTYEVEGYILVGWAFAADATEPASISTSGAKDLIPGSTFTTQQLIITATAAGQSVSLDAAGKIVLYGVWEEDIVSMQDIDSCATIPTNNENILNNTGILKDSRDNQKYSIYHFPTTTGSSMYRLFPGHCIMTQDLKLGMVDGPNTSGSNTTISKVSKGGGLILRSSDSNFDSTYASGSSWTINYAPSSNNGTGWSAADNVQNKQYTYGLSAESGYGYYTQGAALVACPKGWRLLTKDEYNVMVGLIGSGSYGSTVVRNAPYNFVYGGHFFSGGWNAVNMYGYYWSSDQYSTHRGYPFLIESGSLNANANLYVSYGMLVRCMTSEPTIDYIGECSNTIHPSTITSCKMKDDNVWVFGYKSNTITWNDMFTGGTGENGHDATLKSSYDNITICPAGYTVPSKDTYERLLSTQGSSGQIKAALGFSSSDARYFWSSTEYSSNTAYILAVGDYSATTNRLGMGGTAYALCYKSSS